MTGYMVTLPDMIKKISAYYDPKTPIALVINAGFKNGQRVIKGRLDNIVEVVGKEKLPLAHIMYVGPLFKLEKTKSRPLHGAFRPRTTSAWQKARFHQVTQERPPLFLAARRWRAVRRATSVRAHRARPSSPSLACKATG